MSESRSERLGLVGHQLRDDSAEEQGFSGELAASCVGAGWIGPALRIGRVDCVEDRVEPSRELVALGHPERNASLPDLVLRADQTLAHRRGGDMRKAEAIIAASRPSTT